MSRAAAPAPACRRPARRSDGAELIGLCWLLARTSGSFDLEYTFAVLLQESCQSRAETSGACHGPCSAAGSVLLCHSEQAPIASIGGGHLDSGHNSADSVHHGPAMRVLLGVDPQLRNRLLLPISCSDLVNGHPKVRIRARTLRWPGPDLQNVQRVLVLA